MKYPKVLVFTPIYSGKEYCRKQFLEHVKNFTYPNFDFLLIDNSKGTSYYSKLRREGVKVSHVPRGRHSRDALANAQNFARNRAIEGDYDYLLSLESDVFPPLDVIQRLMKHWKPVVGSLYYIGGLETKENKTPRVPCVFIARYNEKKALGGTKLLPPDVHQKMLQMGGLHRIHGMGVGCTLIDISIVKKYPFWTDTEFENKHSDVYWYMDLWNDGVEVYVDYDTVSEHMNSDWGLVMDR